MTTGLTAHLMVFPLANPIGSWHIKCDVSDRDKEPLLEGRYVNMLVTPKK